MYTSLRLRTHQGNQGIVWKGVLTLIFLNRQFETNKQENFLMFLLV